MQESMDVSHMNSREMLDKMRSFGGGYETAANRIEDFLRQSREVDYQDFVDLYDEIWPMINTQAKREQQDGKEGYGRRFTFAGNVVNRLADRPDNPRS